MSSGHLKGFMDTMVAECMPIVLSRAGGASRRTSASKSSWAALYCSASAKEWPTRFRDEPFLKALFGIAGALPPPIENARLRPKRIREDLGFRAVILFLYRCVAPPCMVTLARKRTQQWLRIDVVPVSHRAYQSRIGAGSSKPSANTASPGSQVTSSPSMRALRGSSEDAASDADNRPIPRSLMPCA